MDEKYIIFILAGAVVISILLCLKQGVALIQSQEKLRKLQESQDQDKV